MALKPDTLAAGPMHPANPAHTASALPAHLSELIGKPVHDIDTPALVIDLDAMDVWERFALLASKVGDFTAESMRASFVQAAKAQGYVEGPKAESAGGKKTTV